MGMFLDKAVAAINKESETLDSIELISDTTRLQPLQDIIVEKFSNNYSDELRRTLNA